MHKNILQNRIYFSAELVPRTKRIYEDKLVAALRYDLSLKDTAIYVRGSGKAGTRKKSDTLVIKTKKTWSQSYDCELQRQRCKFLQRHG
jgi:hypothetical protein